MNWLNNLIFKISSISDEEIEIQKPKEKVANGERVIGSIINLKDLQKFYTFYRMLLKDLGDSNFYNSSSSIATEAKVVKIAFWEEVRKIIKNNKNIDIREDWQIVEIPEETSRKLSLKIIERLEKILL
ncbi:TPA: hypothetical protein DD445_00705 [Candidatus Nomurabacteria bacterium]|nr:hypothetical protein [Candidatus Nomurabacteria bacterium]HBP27302.1 hypothetical protein [Candidatus Nomurabacteria bacterium]HBR66403.1 hypothetical protein [Candidatus Nomurabacteria bacterium]HCU46819.1 hypothetical protein [Candidatus Nomurabacteria bacterium]